MILSLPSLLEDTWPKKPRHATDLLKPVEGVSKVGVPQKQGRETTQEPPTTEATQDQPIKPNITNEPKDNATSGSKGKKIIAESEEEEEEIQEDLVTRKHCDHVLHENLHIPREEEERE